MFCSCFGGSAESGGWCTCCRGNCYCQLDDNRHGQERYPGALYRLHCKSSGVSAKSSLSAAERVIHRYQLQALFSLQAVGDPARCGDLSFVFLSTALEQPETTNRQAQQQ